jgi:aspartate kinase
MADADQGHSVIVVVSAMGKTTDKLLGMVAEVTDRPDAREVDMLLATGEQVSISMLTIVLQAMGRKAMSMTGPQVGIMTDSVHRKARIRHINTERINAALKDGNIVIVAGFRGRRPTVRSPRWAGAARTRRRWRWRRRSKPTAATSTPTWTAFTRPTRGW